MKKLLKTLLIALCFTMLCFVAACNLGSSKPTNPSGSTGDPEPEQPYLTIVSAVSDFTVGDKGTFTATNSDDDDSVTVSWSVDNSAVLTIDAQSGAYEAKSAGEFTVTAQAEGYTEATFEGEVKKSEIVPAVTVSESVSMFYGDDSYLIPTVTYNGEALESSDFSVKYEVADATVLSVSENGKITALKDEECSTTVTVTVTYGDVVCDPIVVSVAVKTKTYVTLNVYQGTSKQEGTASCISLTSSKLTTEVSVVVKGEAVSDPTYTLSVIEGGEFVQESADGGYDVIGDGTVVIKAECEIDGQTYFATYSAAVKKSSYTCHSLAEENGNLVCKNDGCEFSVAKSKISADLSGIDAANAVACFVNGEQKNVTNGKIEFSQKEIISAERKELQIQLINEDLSVNAFYATLYTKIIKTAEDLRSAKNLLDSEGRAYFKLNANIENVGDWTNGDCINDFKNGVFDGGIYDENGTLTGVYKISGLTLSGGGEFGLFGFTENSTFKNFEAEVNMNVSATNDGGAALIYQTGGGTIENVKLSVTAGVGVGASGDRVYGALIARQWMGGTTTIKNCEIIGDSNTAGENSFAALINVNMWQDAHITIENVRIENFATALSTFNDPARLTAQDVLDGKCDKVTATNLTSEKTVGIYGNNYLDENGAISGFTIENGDADVYCGETKVGSVSGGTLTLTGTLTVGGEHRLVLKDSGGNAVSLFKNSESSEATDKLNVMFVSKIIKTVDELKDVADNLNGAYLKLEADLTVGDWTNGDCINEFNSGVFDGGVYDEDGALIGKHKLSGLNLTGGGEFGLFGFTTSSTFKNFEVEMIMSVSATNDGGAALIYQTAGGNIENVKLTVSVGVGVGASGDRIYGVLIARQWAGGTTIIKNCEIIGDSNTAGANSFAAIINVNMWQDAHITIENVRIENFATALSTFNDPARLTAQDVLDGKCDKVTATNLTSEKTVGIYGNNYLDENGAISGFTIENGDADVYCGETKVGSVSGGTLTLTGTLTVGGEHRLVLKDSGGNAVSLFKNSESSEATDKLNVMFVSKIIKTVDELKDVADNLSGAYLKLEADLTVGDWTNGDCINEFNNGMFDGGIYDEDGALIGKHKLNGIVLKYGDNWEHEFGLFGFTTGSTFKNFEAEVTNNVSATDGGGAALIYQTAGGTVENVKLTLTVGEGAGASGDRVYGALIARQWAGGTTIIKNCEIIGDENTAGENSFAAIINVNMWQDAHITIENVRIENFATALSTFNDPARFTAQDVLDGKCDKVIATNLTNE